MGMCELCGKNETQVLVDVEDSHLQVCGDCKGFGTLIRQRPEQTRVELRPRVQAVEQPPVPEITEMVVEDYAQKLRQGREKLGITQKEFGKRIAEKESVIHSLESRRNTPNITLARKLEKFLGISLVETYKETHEQTEHTPNEYTIGDLLKKGEKK